MTSHSSLPSRISFFCEVIFLRTSASAFSSSRKVAVKIATTCWRMVSRSSTNSTSSLETSTSVIWWESRMIFSRLSRMQWRPALAQNKLAVASELSFHLFVHFLVRDSGSSHFILMLRQDVAHFVVEPIFDGDFFHHLCAHARNHRFRRFRFDLISFDEALHNFRSHVGDIVPINEHSDRYPSETARKSVYWQHRKSATRRENKRNACVSAISDEYSPRVKNRSSLVRRSVE